MALEPSATSRRADLRVGDLVVRAAGIPLAGLPPALAQALLEEELERDAPALVIQH